jgi:hypothetical protein
MAILVDESIQATELVPGDHRQMVMAQIGLASFLNIDLMSVINQNHY